jgi:hypothetical protein
MTQPLHDWLEPLSELERKLARWDTSAAEDLDRDGAWAMVVPVGSVLVTKACGLFRELSELSGDADSDDELALFSEPAQLSANGSANQPAVASPAFIAELEARQMRTQLDKLAHESSKWRVLEVCQRTRRRLLKAVTAVANELHQELGIPASRDAFVEELTRSLRCRTALASFWFHVERSRHEPVLKRLRLAGTAIATLHGSDGYRELRIGDRVALRDLQTRLLGWLRSSTRSTTEADRLLQDLDGFISLTRRLNGRMELVEHDRSLVSKLRRDLESLGGEQVSDPLLANLRHLTGLCPSLDALLLGRAPFPANAATHCLAQWQQNDGLNHSRIGTTAEFERARLSAHKPSSDSP